ncbi:MAG TPA: hypothetical protein VG714_07395 [Acidobacteriaceae bacterium]|nr:hypothetical protein [Acidobacteriaceae bacterium]
MPPIDLPSRYKSALASLPSLEVEFGAGGIKLFTDAELAEGQIGYAVGRDSRPLDGWQANWIVIGNDTGLGDPIILDAADPALPILTAWNGEGTWNLRPVSISIEAFALAFAAFASIAQNRSNPVQVKENPLSESEREEYLAKISELQENKRYDFWEGLLAYGD